MTKNNCKNCENGILLNAADLQIKLDQANRYIELLEKCIDNTQ